MNIFLVRRTFIVILTLFVANALASSVPNRAGLDEAKLREIPKRMQAFVDDSTIAGAVTLVARNGEVAALDAVGFADIAAHKPMRTDSLFWIASMTKPITATAVMILQEEGKLSIDDPVHKYLPEFKDQWLIDTRSSNSMTLKRPARAITIRDLLTHTSGLADVAAPRPNCTLAELAMAYSQQPLKFEPGSKWEYCNSGINTLGRIIEVASGQGFAEFLQEHIFSPLGMKETTFWPTASQAKRIAKTYQPAKEGKGLEEAEIWFIKGNLPDRSRTPFPSGGLFSTAQDMFRFYQMVLDGGSCNGKKIVSRQAVEQMTRTQTADIRTGFTEGMTWGLGWGVVKQPSGVTAMLSAGSFGHGGAYGTQGWVDAKKGMIYVLMIQRAKFGNSDASPVRQAFQEAAAAALEQ